MAGVSLEINYKSAAPDTHENHGGKFGSLVGYAISGGVIYFYPPAAALHWGWQLLGALISGGFFGGAGAGIGAQFTREQIMDRKINIIYPQKYREWKTTASREEKEMMRLFIRANFSAVGSALGREAFSIPLKTSCGHTFEAQKIYTHLQTSSRCPSCRASGVTKDTLLLDVDVLEKILETFSVSTLTRWQAVHPEVDISEGVKAIAADARDVADKVIAHDSTLIDRYQNNRNSGTIDYTLVLDRFERVGLLGLVNRLSD